MIPSNATQNIQRRIKIKMSLKATQTSLYATPRAMIKTLNATQKQKTKSPVSRPHTTRLSYHPKSIKETLKRYVAHPDAEFYIFGSRARGKFREYSDVDIAIDSSDLTSTIKSKLELEFELSDEERKKFNKEVGTRLATSNFDVTIEIGDNDRAVIKVLKKVKNQKEK